MHINSERLRAFHQLCKDRNFHRAAEHIHISQSALSQRIMKLEQDIETTLVVRGVDGVSLTDAGEKLFDFACNLYNMEQDTLASIKHGEDGCLSGSLRIAAYSSILRSAVTPSLAPLVRKSSEIHVEFFRREMNQIPAMLKTGEADFILLDYAIEDATMKSQQVGTEHLVHIQNQNCTDEDQVFLDHDANDMTTYDYFKNQRLKPKAIRRNYYDDIYGIINGVQLGMGQAIVSRHLIHGMDEIRVIEHKNPVSNPVMLYYNRNRYLTRLHRAVIENLQQNIDGFLS